MQLEVKKVRILKNTGMEGDAYTGEVWVDGEKAATFRNSGDGGPNCYDWIWKERPHAPPFMPEKVLLWVRAHPEYKPGADEWLLLDVLVAEAMDAYENTKRFKRLCRTRTLFRVPGDPPDQYHKLFVPFSAVVRRLLIQQYGAEVEIVNDRFTWRSR